VRPALKAHGLSVSAWLAADERNRGIGRSYVKSGSLFA
jgi:hypothetical protein